MLCQTEDGRETIKILDFGIAKLMIIQDLLRRERAQ